MDFTEDSKLVEQGRRFYKKSARWQTWFEDQLVFEPGSPMTIVTKLGYFILGFLIKEMFALGWAGFFLSSVICYFAILIFKRIMWKKNEKKETKIWNSLNAKYIPLRNEYIENKAEEIGCTSINKETTDMREKEWDLPCKSGYIKGDWCSKTYIHSMQDNYGDIVIIGEKRMAETENQYEMDETYKKEGYSVLDVGVSDFNKRFRVYTKDPVKARTYFSATMIQDYLNKGMDIDYKVLGNNLYFEVSGVTITPELNFVDNDISYYFEEAEYYFEKMLEFKSASESDENFMFR